MHPCDAATHAQGCPLAITRLTHYGDRITACVYFYFCFFRNARHPCCRFSTSTTALARDQYKRNDETAKFYISCDVFDEDVKYKLPCAKCKPCQRKFYVLKLADRNEEKRGSHFDDCCSRGNLTDLRAKNKCDELRRWKFLIAFLCRFK